MKKINWTFVIIALIIGAFLIGYGKNNLSGGLPKKELVSSVKDCSGKELTIKEIKPIPVLGEESAKVLVEVYSDYQCPFCSSYYSETIKQAIEDYVKTGKIKLAYKELAFEGDRSEWAAEAVRCANDQGKFWEYHDKIFAAREASNGTEVYEKESLKKFAKELGLDECEFNLCLDSGKYTEEIQKETQAGFDKGINGTPTTLFNGKIVKEVFDGQEQSLGAMPYDLFKTKIEEALNSIKE